MKQYLNSLKACRLAYILYAILFSLMTVFDRHIIIDPTADRSTIQNTFFSDLDIRDLLLFVIVSVIAYLIICAVPAIKKDSLFNEARNKKPPVFLLFLFIIALSWLPYLFSYWPGGVYSDTMNSLWIATGEHPMTTHEPFFYSLLWVTIIKVTHGSLEPSEYIGLYTFTVLQYLAMASLLSSFLYWNYKRGLKKVYLTIMTLIFAFFPLFPYYAISLWKDTVFGMMIFLFSWLLFCLNEKVLKHEKITLPDQIKFVLMCVLVCFFRNNGIYAVIFVCLIFVLSLIKAKELFKRFAVISVLTILACFIVQHPLFDSLGYNVDTAIESLGIPLQQTAYIVATDGKLSEQDAVYIDSIMPLENWRVTYNPTTVDYIKFDASFDRDGFNESIPEFFRTYISICIKNPVKAVKAYLLSTYGYWDLYKSSGVAYVGCESIAWTGIFQSDYFDYYTGIAFRDIVYPKHYISSALWLWLLLLALGISLYGRQKRLSIAMMPALGIWLTIMLAVPVAYSFRYVFSVFLCVPIYILCMISEKE